MQEREQGVRVHLTGRVIDRRERLQIHHGNINRQCRFRSIPFDYLTDAGH